MSFKHNATTHKHRSMSEQYCQLCLNSTVFKNAYSLKRHISRKHDDFLMFRAKEQKVTKESSLLLTVTEHKTIGQGVDVDLKKKFYDKTTLHSYVEVTSHSETPQASTSQTPQASTSEMPRASTSEMPRASTSQTPQASTSEMPQASTSEMPQLLRHHSFH